MPTLLRFLIGFITFVYLQIAIGADVLVVALGGHETPWGLALTGAGIAFLVIIGMTAGLSVSYLRWSDEDGRRRLRRLLVIGAAVQAVAAAAVVVGAGTASGPALAVAVAVVVVGLGLDVAFVALGRAARSRDRLDRSGDAWVDSSTADIRRGWRNGVIGFVSGVVIGAVLVTVALVLRPGRPPIVLQVGALGVAFAFLGASIGLSIAAFRIARSMRQATGDEFSTARRIGRVVLRGKPEQLSPEEEQRAARYARIARRWMPYQLAQVALLYTGLVLIQVGSLFDHDDSLRPVQLAEIVLLVVLYAALTPLMVSRTRRAGRYADAHPIVQPAPVPEA